MFLSFTFHFAHCKDYATRVQISHKDDEKGSESSESRYNSSPLSYLTSGVTLASSPSPPSSIDSPASYVQKSLHKSIQIIDSDCLSNNSFLIDFIHNIWLFEQWCLSVYWFFLKMYSAKYVLSWTMKVFWHWERSAKSLYQTNIYYLHWCLGV